MDGEAIAQWAATGLIAVGMIATWLRNNRSSNRKSGKEFGELKGKVDGLSGRIDGMDQKIDNMTSRIDTLISQPRRR